METVILMSAYNADFHREKAVRTSAELLRDSGIAFFPLDIRRLLKNSFSHQIKLIPYKELGEISLKESADGITDPRTLSKDGFCMRVRDVLIDLGSGPVTSNIWNIYYNESSLQERIRFTLLHELGHVFLGHHQLLGMDSTAGVESMPEYREADNQADQFSINALAPAPAVARLLREHGFTCMKNGLEWRITNRNAPFLQNLGLDPDPVQLIMTAFQISRAAAATRLRELNSELQIWQQLDPELYTFIEGIGHRSGWYCWVCSTRRRTASAYCPGCGKGWSYEYKDFGRPSRPVMGLRRNGQFEFCSVCGNSSYPEDAAYCPVCGSPVINECENAHYTDGDFIRSGMYVVRGTHRCRPTDIYCGKCGVLTVFGAQHGPRKNLWLPQSQERCRTKGTLYPQSLETENGRLLACPSCGSTRTIRDGRYCAECMQPMENSCTGGSGSHHVCDPNDRYCSVCGQPTLFQEAGFLPDYTNTETYRMLRDAEAGDYTRSTVQILIMPDGTTQLLKQEANEWQASESSPQERQG